MEQYVCVESINFVFPYKEKAALPGGKTAYLARLCIAIDLISDAVSVKRGCLQKNSELKEEGRSDLAMASLGP